MSWPASLKEILDRIAERVKKFEESGVQESQDTAADAKPALKNAQAAMENGDVLNALLWLKELLGGDIARGDPPIRPSRWLVDELADKDVMSTINEAYRAAKAKRKEWQGRDEAGEVGAEQEEEYDEVRSREAKIRNLKKNLLKWFEWKLWCYGGKGELEDYQEEELRRAIQDAQNYAPTGWIW